MFRFIYDTIKFTLVLMIWYAMLATVIIYSYESYRYYKPATEVTLMGRVDLAAAEKIRIYLKTNMYPVNTIRINSYGGLVNQGYHIINAMQRSPKSTHCIVSGEAASMAAVILSYCNTIDVDDRAIVLVHLLRTCNLTTCTILNDLKQPEVRLFIETSKPLLKLLTREEKQRFIQGEDVIITGKDFKERWHANRTK